MCEVGGGASKGGRRSLARVGGTGTTESDPSSLCIHSFMGIIVIIQSFFNLFMLLM